MPAGAGTGAELTIYVTTGRGGAVSGSSTMSSAVAWLIQY
jgi:hypothetical protein